MRINFTPQYNIKTPALTPTNNVAVGKTSAAVSFRGYFLDPEKYDPAWHDGIYYFCEHLEEGEKPKRGQSLCGLKKDLVFNRNFTSFFRDDVNWLHLGCFLKEKFKDEDKVNTVVYACANGLEAYTFSLLIQKTFPKDCEKFFPIIAKDVSKRQIEENKLKQKGDVRIIFGDVMRANEALSLDLIDGYKEYATKNRNGECVLDDKIKAPVVFETANILEDLDSLDSNVPTIFACRNMWPYVNSEEYQAFSDELYKRLASGSVVIIGDFDYTGAQVQRENSIAKAFIQSGFLPVNAFYNSALGNSIIFEKK